MDSDMYKLQVITKPLNNISERTSNVEIIVHKTRKPFLGGYRQPRTGLEYHNATCQTVKGMGKDLNDGKLWFRLH